MSDKWSETIGYTIIDPKTGEYPDLREIALKEKWAKSLMYCDIEGFAIDEDGVLIQIDSFPDAIVPCGECKLVNDSPYNWAINYGDCIWRALR